MERSAESSSHDFTWDENSQLFFHSSTGFYHDPHAGWYYSSRDGLYYKFEKGSYVLLKTDKIVGEKCTSNFNQDETHMQGCCGNSDYNPSFLGAETETFICGPTDLAESSLEKPEDIISQVPDNPPPSEWLEETLIYLYLSGYPNQEDETSSFKISDVDDYKSGAGGDNNSQVLEEGEWVVEDNTDEVNSRGDVLDEDSSWEEDKWRAQYGQVTQSARESIRELSAIDLWDWELVKESKKSGKNLVTKLVGRVVKKSAKLHPSMPSVGRLLKTAPISEAHLDLVRVTTGKLYKLRSPSTKYLASISAFDSSDPTKEWCFPELWSEPKQYKDSGCDEFKSAAAICKDFPATGEKSENRSYRDRAAERRRYHGGYGDGPGQKRAHDDDTCLESDSIAETSNMSFGVDSYAKKLLQNMGWKEGEGLGKSVKGIVGTYSTHWEHWKCRFGMASGQK